jgi:hypothetical protein
LIGGKLNAGAHCPGVLATSFAVHRNAPLQISSQRPIARQPQFRFAMAIVQVFYISRCDHTVSPTDVHRIVGSSQVRNRRRQVTGLLAYSGRHFAQVVEGSADDVDGLLSSISNDPRHQEMKILQRLERAERRFGNWSMHLVDSVARADEIERLFDTPSSTGATDAMQLLDAITADVQWHHADDLAPRTQSRS